MLFFICGANVILFDNMHKIFLKNFSQTAIHVAIQPHSEVLASTRP